MKVFSVILATIFLLAGCAENVENVPVVSIISESSTPKNENSGYDNPYTSCVPEWSVSSPESGSYYAHSSDSSSSYEQNEGVFIPKAKVGSDYFYIDETLASLPESRLGTAEELERWKAEISDMENVYELVIHYVECEDRYLSADEVYSFIDDLQTQSPGIFEQPENPATGGAYCVAAHGFDGEIKWIFVWGGFYTVCLPEYGILLDFDAGETYFDSLAKICSYRSPMNNP